MALTRRFAHPVAIAVVAAISLAVSTVVAVQRPLLAGEVHLTTWLNDAPDALAVPLYPVMQLGTIWAPVAVAVLLVIVTRDWLLAGVVVAAGLVAWFGAKLLKRGVERGRPLAYIPGIDVREGSGTGLGFVSGHSAVAAATATVAMVALPPRWRPVAVAAALLVGLARIVYGVHLPADVVGGWSFGVLIGLGAVTLVRRIELARVVHAAPEASDG